MEYRFKLGGCIVIDGYGVHYTALIFVLDFIAEFSAVNRPALTFHHWSLLTPLYPSVKPPFINRLARQHGFI